MAMVDFVEELLKHVQKSSGRESGTECFTWRQHHDAAVSFGREHIHQGVAVLVQGHRGVGLQQLSVDGAQDAHIVVGPLEENNDGEHKNRTHYTFKTCTSHWIIQI